MQGNRTKGKKRKGGVGPTEFRDMDILSLKSFPGRRPDVAKHMKLDNSYLFKSDARTKELRWYPLKCPDCGESCAFPSDRKVPLLVHPHIGCRKV